MRGHPKVRTTDFRFLFDAPDLHPPCRDTAGVQDNNIGSRKNLGPEDEELVDASAVVADLFKVVGEDVILTRENLETSWVKKLELDIYECGRFSDAHSSNWHIYHAGAHQPQLHAFEACLIAQADWHGVVASGGKSDLFPPPSGLRSAERPGSRAARLLEAGEQSQLARETTCEGEGALLKESLAYS